jgi:LuxR family maltose regulon positive regulatory protein
LLKGLLKQGFAVEFIQEVLSEMRRKHAADEITAAAKELGYFDPLSERELVVLRMLVTDLTTPEIAEDLVVSVNTVRTHIKNIYGKIGVHSRFEAISKAKELGLL